jgi:hypothetical protein
MDREERNRIYDKRQDKGPERDYVKENPEYREYPDFQDLQAPSEEEEQLSRVLKKEDLEEFHRYKKKDLTAYYYIGREEDEENIVRILEETPGPLAITGVHGVGKSALISHLSDQLRKQEGWIVVEISNRDSAIPLFQFLSEEIYQEADPAIRKMVEVISGIRVENGQISINAPGEKYRSIQYRMLINSMVRILKEAGCRLLLVMDPLAEDREEVRDLIALSQGLSRGGYPLSLILPASPADKLSIRAYPLEMLNPWDVKEAYNQLFTDQVGLSEDDLLHMTRLTGGYPLAYRMLLDQIRENPDLDSAHLSSVESSYRTGLFRGVYYELYQSLSRVEKQILDIIGESQEEDVPLTSICEKLGRPKSYLSVYRKRLLNAQIVRTEIRGTLRFTFPMFGDFLREYRILFQGK